MATTLPITPPTYDTLADAVHALGDVPLDRILWHPPPGTATEEDQLRFLEREPKRFVELIDGTLVEKAMGQREGFFAASLIAFLMAYVRPLRLGVVGAPDTILRIDPRLNRLPDVSFTSWQSLPSDDAHLLRVGAYAPDLAVEILSEGNTRREMARKRREYFAAGTKLVWIIDPDARTAAVYADPTAPDTAIILSDTDTLTGGTVLPGFTLSLAELFNDPQLNPRPTGV